MFSMLYKHQHGFQIDIFGCDHGSKIGNRM